MSSPITTHVLDTSRGRPAEDIEVQLEQSDPAGPRTFRHIGSGRTNADGRLRDLLPEHTRLEPGVFRLTFNTGEYFQRLGLEGFYPEVSIIFHIRATGEHYHVPLLLNPFGYSTYRGS